MPHEVRPRIGELQQARALTETALDACERELPREDRDALTASLAWTADPLVGERFAGVAADCPGPGEVRIAFDADAAGWADALRAQVARAYGQAHVVGALDGGVVFAWQHLLAEAAGAALVARLYPDDPTPWRDPGPDASTAAAWAAVADRLGERVGPGSPPGAAADPAMPAALGAAVHEGLNRDLERYPGATRSDVLAAGNRRLGE
jgi:hypothetical protein